MDLHQILILNFPIFETTIELRLNYRVPALNNYYSLDLNYPVEIDFYYIVSVKACKLPVSENRQHHLGLTADL